MIVIFKRKLKIWKTKYPTSSPNNEKGVKKYADIGKYLNGKRYFEGLYKLGKSFITIKPAL